VSPTPTNTAFKTVGVTSNTAQADHIVIWSSINLAYHLPKQAETWVCAIPAAPVPDKLPAKVRPARQPELLYLLPILQCSGNNG
jgi:hypothetical protein